MTIRTPSANLAIAALAASFALLFLAADAMAAKEKFERTKPHVNVGTIGHVDQGKSSQIDGGGDGATLLQNGSSVEQDCQAEPSKANGQSSTC